MALLNKTKIMVVKYPYTNLKYVNPYREYGISGGYRLSSANVDADLNITQFNNTAEYYGIDLKFLNGKK
jgi:hypothetical protein